MSAKRLFSTLVTAGLCASVVAVVAPVSVTPVRANSDRLRIDFASSPASTVLTAGTPIADVSGQGNHGVVVTAYGGSISTVASPTGVAADFPGKCSKEPCPNALVDVPDNPSLDPLTADFEWGARILMQANETAAGENVVQKGRFDEVGGQWKLQVDKTAGIPSCLVSGKVPGQTTERQVLLFASISVSNGVWHQITCRRTAAAGVQIIIDGVLRGSASMPVVMLNSSADVTIGAKDVIGSDNDQFLGVLDDAFMTVLDGTLPSNTPPTAAFTFSCVDLGCTFDASGSTDNGPMTYAWDFGDGGSATGVGASHDFGALGDHLVTLTVTDGLGLSDSIEHTVTIAENTAPTPMFTFSCVDLGCTFDASGSTDNGPMTYAWDFGDGGSATGVGASHDFGALGDHLVTLTVTDGPGLSDSIQHTVTIAENTLPVAAFTSSCTALVCTFDASTSSDTGPLAYAWTFGDGGTAVGVAPSHTYAAAGTYPVVLTVTDAFAATSSVEQQVTATQPVVPITFVAQSSVSGSKVSHVANVPAAVRAGDGVLMFFSLATNATVTQPTGVTGWVQVDTLTNANGSTRVWRKVAAGADAGKQVKISISAISKGTLTIVAYRGTSTSNPVAGFARTLVTTNSANRTTPITNVDESSVVVSYWMHRDSSTTTLTAPSGVAVRARGTQSGSNHVTVLTADSSTPVPVGTYGGLTARARAASTLATTWTIVLARA